jgi:MoaA/NifB/PqqE/SkfB family radical SAM enzyme
MKALKAFVKSNKKLFRIAQAARLVQTSSFAKIDGSRRKYPTVLQLPITYKCNSHCVMCNIWHMDHSDEMSAGELAGFIRDPIFRRVSSVGINGGEPSLVPDLPLYAREVLELPNLQSLNIISNGFSQKLLLKPIEDICRSCRDKGVAFHVSISLDGVGSIHDTVRGTRGAFEGAVSTIDQIVKNTNRYCDSFDVACTIVWQNVDYLAELDAYARLKGYPMKYRLGIENKRIGSDTLRDEYSVLIESSAKQSAKEFMHSRFFEATDLSEKFRYFSMFYWLNSEKPKRLLGCDWKEEGITMDARGDLYYCAVESNRIGGLRQESGEEVFLGDGNVKYREGIIRDHCDGCIHDYGGKPELRNLIPFFRELLTDRLAMTFYRVRCKSGLL